MGALTASRWNPVIRDFYQRLLEWQADESCPHSLYAKVACDPQLHPQASLALVRPDCKGYRQFLLTFNTVAIRSLLTEAVDPMGCRERIDRSFRGHLGQPYNGSDSFPGCP